MIMNMTFAIISKALRVIIVIKIVKCRVQKIPIRPTTPRSKPPATHAQL